ncbi:MAG: AI-2E family transporter [Proteobacteria bacterium]|nr:AI-2E family transporter [Pseudomonadota bacterium]MBU4471419.1 AI-2E family transporter [Pseudomonadota bacterium]MCG2752424.1 AI-2E family transporter [Desulfobacteraceae bacterium]
MQRHTINNLVLLVLIFLISALFLSMIRSFLMALFLAGIFSALAQPVYRKINEVLKDRPRSSSLITLLLFVLVVLIPLSGLVSIITAQAVKVGQSITPWVQRQIADPSAFSEILKEIPFYDEMLPYQSQILSKAGELASKTSVFLVNSLSAGALGTVHFIFMFFVFLYVSYFFIMDGKSLIDRILYYLPLEDENEKRLLGRFTSVARATLKGTALIGTLQGVLAGIAFALVGIEAAVFWGTVMTALSIIPALGSALVWVPASIILAAGGSYGKAAGLAVFCGLVVGSLDNVLRPRLVGKDTQMHDLMIFLGTMGGIALFGVIGFIIGPIIAALFVTIWDIYGEVFRNFLPSLSKEEDIQKESIVEDAADISP